MARLRNLGIQRDIGACLYNMALLARAEGRTAQAAQLAGESLAIKHSSEELFDLAQCLELVAGVGADSGLGAPAARGCSVLPRPCGRGSGLVRARTNRTPAQSTRPFATLVGDDGLAAGIAEGETWALEHAVAEAAEIASVVSRRRRRRCSSRRSRDRCRPALSSAAQRLRLTARELEVLGYLVQRYTDREIAGALTISLRTVTTHVGRILTKLGVDGRRQAATEATRLGTARLLIGDSQMGA